MGTGIGRNFLGRMVSRETRWTLAMFLCGAAISAFGYFVYPAPDVRQGTGISPGEFAPSLFLVAGRGFMVPVDFDAPELAPFFRREVSRFDPATLPEDIALTQPGDWDQRHRYLYYAGAVIWWIFGISWPAMKLLPILLYGSMWPLLFRIFRLAGGRKLSAACTALFMLNPVVVNLHWTVRDFSKAPFFLAVILIIGLLLQRRMGARRLLMLALGAGVIAGIGVGFRRDLVMAVLPALVAIGVAPRLTARRPWAVKAGAAAVLLAAFGIVGAPIHAAYFGVGDPHDAIMGFSRPVDAGLGVKQADYQHMPIQSDFQIHASMVSAARRVDGQTVSRHLTPERIDETGLELVRWLTLTYPADMVTRALASARWALSGDFPVNPATLWIIWLVGVVLPAVTLFIVGSASTRRGLALFLVCAPLFTYIALQFGSRHGFHLTFAPLWCALFLYTQYELYRRYRRHRSRDSEAVAPAFLRRDGQWRGLLVLALAAAVLLTPLAVARAIQHHQVTHLVARYLEAERTPIPTMPRPVGEDWTLFALDPNTPEPEVPYNRVNWPFREAYLVAVFAPGPSAIEGVVKYEAESNVLDLGFTFWMPPSPEDAARSFYFFPVFENWHLAHGDWNRFSGIALPNEAAHRFQGLYRLDQPEAFPFWSLYRIQEDGQDFTSARRLVLARPEPPERIAPVVSMPSWLYGVDRTMGQYSGVDPVKYALPRVRAALNADPQDASLWVWLGDILDLAGDTDEALEAYLRAADLLPRHLVVYRHLAAFAENRLNPEEALALWGELAERHPESVHAHIRLGNALLAAGVVPDAIASAKQAITVAPWYREGYRLLASVLEAMDSPPDARAIWQEIVDTHPDSELPRFYLAEHFQRTERDLELAAGLFLQAIERAPYFADARIQYAYARWQMANHEEAIEAFHAYLEFGGAPATGHLALASLYLASDEIDAARIHAREARKAGMTLPAPLEELLD